MKINDFTNKDNAKISAKEYRYFGNITDIRKRTLNGRVVYTLYVYKKEDFQKQVSSQERKNYQGEIILQNFDGSYKVKYFNYVSTTKDEVIKDLYQKRKEYLKRGVFSGVKIGSIIS